MKHTFALLTVVAAVGLAACGKANETAAEKMIESQIAKDGSKAKVDLSQGGMKITTTDASGKTSKMELGNAQISEAELGLPFYPGAKATEGSSMRIVAGNSTSLQVALRSDDAPDKVAAYYRDKLKAMSTGKQLMDMGSPEGASITLVDEGARNTLQVHVSKADKGSDIAIVASREGAK